MVLRYVVFFNIFTGVTISEVYCLHTLYVVSPLVHFSVWVVPVDRQRRNKGIYILLKFCVFDILVKHSCIDLGLGLGWMGWGEIGLGGVMWFLPGGLYMYLVLAAKGPANLVCCGSNKTNSAIFT